MFIDTHAHLTFPDFDKDREDVIKNAKSAGVECVVNIGSGQGLGDNVASLELAKRFDWIYSTVGFHPHDATSILDAAKGQKNKAEDPFGLIERLSKDPKIVAVGEIGLDYHYLDKDRSAPAQKKADQIDCFVRLLSIARKARLPIIVHDRDAHNDTIFTIRRENGAEFGGVMANAEANSYLLN